MNSLPDYVKPTSFHKALYPHQEKWNAINPFQNMEMVESIYKELILKSEHSFFNSWEWVYSWLTMLPKDSHVEFIVHYDDKGDKYIACYFLGTRYFSKFGLTKRKGYLNNTGNMEFDKVTVEYNRPLVIKEYQDKISDFLLIWESFDDIVIPVTDLKIAGSSRFYRNEYKHPLFLVDLERIRDSKSDYLSFVSKNKRQQIKRSLKAYGDIKITTSRTKEEAKEWLIALSELHQAEWIKRGEKGAFSDSYFINFHTSLINNAFDKGNIQICKIYNSKSVIGYIYNFISNNEILFYQSGFKYEDDNKLRPGLVSHYLAIELNKEFGMKAYNFLAGYSKYKESLSTDMEYLFTYTMTKKNFKSKIEKLIKNIIGK